MLAIIMTPHQWMESPVLWRNRTARSSEQGSCLKCAGWEAEQGHITIHRWPRATHPRGFAQPGNQEPAALCAVRCTPWAGPHHHWHHLRQAPEKTGRMDALHPTKAFRRPRPKHSFPAALVVLVLRFFELFSSVPKPKPSTLSVIPLPLPASPSFPSFAQLRFPGPSPNLYSLILIHPVNFVLITKEQTFTSPSPPLSRLGAPAGEDKPKLKIQIQNPEIQKSRNPKPRWLSTSNRYVPIFYIFFFVSVFFHSLSAPLICQ
ncbi:hypothetical protein B0T22DRAFT_131258 [Podospora appendiculata]|uniref:Uncharacterized protein n=1 Tax=Podospora appendiculata TaxID=314037 RepID=A0AAE0X7Z4_9PEZI|nr:hypothetical protein B0T22DRAFT_131258 [Podospora appendiculata]